MSVTFETIVECMIHARDDDEYDEAYDVLYNYEGPPEAGAVWSDLMQEWIHNLLLRMHQNPLNERLLQGCAKVICTFNSHSCWDVVSEIFEFMTRHRGDSSITRLCLALVLDEYFDIFEKIYLDDGSISVFLDIMNLTDENRDAVQEGTIALFDKCLKHSGGMSDLYGNRHGSIATILQAMHNHLENANVQVIGCEILICLAHARSEEQWSPATILQATNAHPHHSRVQVSAFSLLIKAWKQADSEELRAVISGSDYTQAFLRAMDNHPNDIDVHSCAVFILHEIIMSGNNNVSQIIQEGGVQRILQAVKVYLQSNQMPLCGISILHRMFEMSADARKAAVDYDAIPVLVKAMHSPLACGNDNSSVWTQRLTVWKMQRLVCLALNDLLLPEDTRRCSGTKVAQEGGIKPIVEHAITTFNDPAIPFCLEDNGILANLVTFADADGMLPLHYAASREGDYATDAQVAVVMHLLEMYPEASKLCNSHGELPLHISLLSNAPLPVVEALLRANAASAEAPFCGRRNDPMLNFPPAVLAATYDCNLDTIFTLLCYAPQVVSPNHGRSDM